MKPAGFLKNLEEHMMPKVTMTSPKRELGTVEEYAGLFKAFDTYPTNLQPTTKKRELQRTNSIILKGNDATQDQSAMSNSSVSLASMVTRLGEQPSITKIFSDFKKFQQKLRQLQDEATPLANTQLMYLSKIAQLETFAQQLEKLMPNEREAPDAFTADEENTLTTIVENMKQLNFLRGHSLPQVDPAAPRIEALVDVLNYTLMQITCYNNA
ncbi:GH16229 [Drosophila grimshawi]|uniref:GH16229 n=2 Tax=Drosophila grimshawi TaxID=7222 RepID=B4IXG8_DROGR|nr:GH16229 [Drosophila grimshawi]